jgi:TolA-binding protein
VRARLSAGPRRSLGLGLALAAAVTTAGCAYFNTFYSAKKNFEEAELQMSQLPDPEVRASAGTAGLYDKAIQGATRILVEYPTTKWVDDALLLIGRSMLAKGDYPAAQEKFGELALNFPTSDLRDQAMFWSGVAAERDRRRVEAIDRYDSLLTVWPQSKLRDQARLRRANLYLLAREPARAEPDLRELAGRKGAIGYEAGLKLAEALFAARRFAEAREEFTRVAERAPTEQLRTDARLRVGDCDEALSDYEAATETYLTLLREARTEDGRARARLRFASALGMAGRVDEGLGQLRNVIEDQPRTPYAAEAAFRSGYLHEVVRDDFAAAREAYDMVAQQLPSSPFVAQATERRASLEDLESFRSARGDSAGVDAAAEAVFRSAELYLFQMGKPDKAIEEYTKLTTEYPNSPLAPRATFARGWVKARRLGDAEGARQEFEAVIARWPESDVASRARVLLDAPADSTFAHDGVPAASVSFPLVPGNMPYVPPAPVVTPRGSSPKPAAGAGKAPVDSAAAAAMARAAAINQARRDSIRARIDSINAAAGGAVPADTAKALEK